MSGSTFLPQFSIEKEQCAVIVVSTTGEGDPPDTASKFWRRIKKKTLAEDYLSQLKYTLLGELNIELPEFKDKICIT